MSAHCQGDSISKNEHDWHGLENDGVLDFEADKYDAIILWPNVQISLHYVQINFRLKLIHQILLIKLSLKSCKEELFDILIFGNMFQVHGELKYEVHLFSELYLL